MNIFTLTGQILVDNNEANKSISATGKEAEGLGSKLGSGIKTAAKWGAAIAGAATVVGGAMVAAAKDTASNLDVIDKASQRMGIAAESYQELAHAADLSGVSMSTMEKAAKALVGTDINFDDAMNSIMALGTEEERTAAATEMFGKKVAYDMQPLLKAGAEGFNAMKQEANDLGLVMSQETVTSGAQLNDMFAKVESSMQALKNGLMADLMPVVVEILQWVLDNMPQIRETVKSLMDAIIPIVKPVLEAIMEMLPPILEAIKMLADWLMPYLEPILNAVAEFVKGFLGLLHGDVEGFWESIKTLLGAVGKALLGIGEDLMGALWDGIKKGWEKLTSWFTDKWEAFKDKLHIGSDDVVSGGSSKPNGRHAAGLAYVPYDGYQAELHKGETVLNAQNTSNLATDIANSIKSALGNGGSDRPIELTLNIDGKAFAKATYDAIQGEGGRRGMSMVTI